MKLKVGDSAPDFSLPSNKGTEVSLSAFNGSKNVVLFFYPRDGSPGCTQQACSFQDSYEVFKKLGAEVVGISGDDIKSHENFAVENLLEYILLSDKGDTVRKLYGASGALGLMPGRVTFVIDKEGVIRHIFSSQLQPKKHIDEALKILREIEAT
jgi:peroxiredoxin Q/BCP